MNIKSMENKFLNEYAKSLLDIDEKYTIIFERDKQTAESLQDKTEITFNSIPNNGEQIDGLSYDDFYSNYTAYYDKNGHNGKLDDYNLQLKSNNPPVIENGNDIVLVSSKMNILFEYPSITQVTFEIKAIDEMKGFTRQEVGLKIMQYFHMLWFLSENYDLENGQIGQVERNNKVFRSVFDEDYIYNGISSIIYNKEKNAWVVQMLDYH